MTLGDFTDGQIAARYLLGPLPRLGPLHPRTGWWLTFSTPTAEDDGEHGILAHGGIIGCVELLQDRA